MQNLSLCVGRPSSGLNPHEPVLVSSPRPQLSDSKHVLIEVDRFGFSTNNITYQALGEAPHFRYFEFNPPPTAGNVSPVTHGLIPVWGFGTIVESTHPEVSVGERVYGYFSPARYLLVPVSDANKHNFYVPRPHLPADRRPYNTIRRCATDPQYDPSPLAEDLTMLYRPLFWTAYWCEDWFNASSYRGATAFLITSASSKTAFCLAYLLKKRRAASGKTIRIVGLTSTRNVAFTTGLGLYDELFEYGSFESAAPLQSQGDKWIYIDVAGNEGINDRIRKHFAPQKNVVAGVQLGLTNLSPSAPSAATTHFSTNTSLVDARNAEPTGTLKLEQFFMPEWLAIRQKQLTVEQIANVQAQAWKDLMTEGESWVKIEQIYGGPAVVQAYRSIAQNGTDAGTGMILSLWDRPELGRENIRSRI
ncbi:hypothetical protein BDY19DRAFT_893251 [Irpex rosettiformis]|uniref:Uncharacterized protein n=1 Tax=Irpex rosettiformis TaxID=378272 RepID=A0ACB8TZB3_9APHY|nr:hypothetical protein BDY19DRAFT_893251 [Irpex rosettiformis]